MKDFTSRILRLERAAGQPTSWCHVCRGRGSGGVLFYDFIGGSYIDKTKRCGECNRPVIGRDDNVVKIYCGIDPDRI